MIKWDQQIGPSLGTRVRFDALRYGIELEFERMLEEYPDLDFWHLERDASLRNNGVEFISVPLLPDDLGEALDEAQERIERYELDASWRCGLHTHINVAYWTWKQLLTHAVLYTLVEPYLFAEWAPGRETSHFCVPMGANTRLIDGIAQDAIALRAGRGVRQTLNMLSCSKYSAVNYKPILEHGTIEFRHMPSTLDMGRVMHWCDMLGQMVDAAFEYGSPEQVITEYEDLGIEPLLNRIGLHTCDIVPEDEEDGYIAACMMVGHDPQRWQDLQWEPPGEIEVQVWDEFVVQQENMARDDMERLMEILEGDE